MSNVSSHGATLTPFASSEDLVLLPTGGERREALVRMLLAESGVGTRPRERLEDQIALACLPPKFAGVVASPSANAYGGHAAGKALDDLQEIIAKAVDSVPMMFGGAVMVRVPPRFVLIIIGVPFRNDDRGDQEVVAALARQVRRKANDAYGLPVDFGASRCYEASRAVLRGAFLEACKSLEMSFYRRTEDRREIILAAPACPTARASPMVRELFSAASFTDLPRVRRLWTQCAREYEICGAHPSALKDLALSMVERLNISLDEGRAEVDDSREEEPKSCSQRIVAAASIEVLESVFNEFLDRMTRRMGRALRDQDIIEQIRKFVAEHYAERLSLDRIAQTFFISPTYFCRLFKNRTGRSFLRYLAEVRIRKAIVLMRSTRMSIEEISEEVGYQSANYFIRVFKKIMGVTVGEFMKRSIGVYGKTFIHCEEKAQGFA